MLARAVTLFGCFVLAAALIAHSSQFEPTPIREPLAFFPMTLGEWRGVQEPPFPNNVLNVLGVDDYLTRAYYLSPQSGVGLYIGYYRTQRQGSTIHSPLNCLPGAGWEPVSKATVQIPVTSGPASIAAARIPVNRYVVQKGLDRDLVLYWYQSHGRVVASEYVSRFYLVADAVRLNRSDGAMVRVIAPVLPNVADGEARAERDATRFVQAIFPRLADYLPL